VVVTPGQQGMTLRLEGRLSELMLALSLYPTMRIRASGGAVVAEDRCGQYPTVRLARASV